MPAVTLTTVASFQVIGCREDDKSLFAQVKIFLIKFIRKGHDANFGIFDQLLRYNSENNRMFAAADWNISPVAGRMMQLQDDGFSRKDVEVRVWMDDQGPEELRGNKWHKLKYNLQEASRQGLNKLLTFGGAYSNHIAATACAAKIYGFSSIGIIRGEPLDPLNKTLRQALDNGMQLHFISREQYRKKQEPAFLESLKDRFGNFYLVPEGGSNRLGVKGCEEWMKDLNGSFDVVCLASGTGATLSGISNVLTRSQSAVGFSVLKGGGFLHGAVEAWLRPETQAKWEIQTGYHFGGYGKSTPELLKFAGDFSKKNGLLIEPVYTGKMFFGLTDLIRNNYFRPSTSILAIHTGGLQYL